jgi:hypothetical protein
LNLQVWDCGVGALKVIEMVACGWTAMVMKWDGGDDGMN